VLVLFHIHARPAKSDAFHLQTESLLGRIFSGTFDCAAGTDDSVPRQSWNLPQNAGDLPGGAQPTRRAGDGSVGGNSSLRESADAAHNPGALGVRA
jgi:hypothetical protein